MNILILGASGFIGNACYDYFSQHHAVTGVDLRDQYQKGLLLDPDLGVTKSLIPRGYDAIINCAGSANIKQSFVSRESDFQANTAFVQTILEQLEEHAPQTKFINISSAAVYGNPESLPIAESSKTEPLSPYGMHKLMSEELLRDYAQRSGIPTVSMRIFSAYGTGLRQQFFYDLYAKFKSGQPQADLFGTGNESRDFIFISDIVQALELMIGKGKFKGEVYNLASGTETRISDAANLFATICGYTGQLNFTGQHLEGYPLNWRADISKLKALGFVPKTELEEGLALYFDWLKHSGK